jgi:cytochrome P450
MMHDANVYAKPFEFKPERHMGSSSPPDPTSFVFGFGKRKCPGHYFAQLQLFLNITSLLCVFNVSKAVDGNGQEHEPEIRWRSSTVT